MPRTLTIVALVASGLFSFTTSVVTAETITVCASGCDHTSINAAIDAANNGDVIQLAAETYFEGSPVDTDGKAVFAASIGGCPWSGRSRLETFRRSFVTNTGDSVLNEVVRPRGFGEPLAGAWPSGSVNENRPGLRPGRCV